MLDQDLKDLALVIDGTPQIHVLARDRSVEDGTVAVPERSPVRI